MITPRTEPGLRPAFRPMTLSAKREEQLQQLINGFAIEAASLTGVDLTPLHEALCHSSARLELNHEQMEFLGDAVLRLAAAEYLQDQKSTLSVGERSALRAQLVSDRWLSELAEQLNLDSVILKGPAASSDPTAQATVRAECCEALVGGIYLAWGGADGGLNAVRQWLDPHWQQSCKELAADPHRHNWKSALQEWSQSDMGVLPDYCTEEQNRIHGSPERFHSQVSVSGKQLGEGHGPSRRLAEQEAARQALEQIRPR